MWGFPSYAQMPPANVGEALLIYQTGDRPQVDLLGRGGEPVMGQLTAIAGGQLVDYRTVLSGLPGLIIPTPGGSQALNAANSG